MLRAVLSRYTFAAGEFGRVVTFRIYDEDTLPFSLTGYSVTLLGGSFSSEATPDPNQTVNKGLGSFDFTEQNSPSATGLRHVRFRLVKNGIQLFTARIKVTIQ